MESPYTYIHLTFWISIWGASEGGTCGQLMPPSPSYATILFTIRSLTTALLCNCLLPIQSLPFIDSKHFRGWECSLTLPHVTTHIKTVLTVNFIEGEFPLTSIADQFNHTNYYENIIYRSAKNFCEGCYYQERQTILLLQTHLPSNALKRTLKYKLIMTNSETVDNLISWRNVTTE